MMTSSMDNAMLAMILADISTFYMEAIMLPK
ncbi:hypothetical protein ERO13_D03G106001v2 [Gossypium hirsutum]|nr:hypothetical protein ERO13_D03G106001v2 [Gossypium hirsutum]